MAKEKNKSIGVVPKIIERIAVYRHRLHDPLPDQVFDEVSDALFTSSVHLANVSASSLQDIDLKLAVLCSRLRDQIDPEDRTAVLNALLAESIRDDLLTIGSAKV